jgi:hypothetical protein
MEYPELIFKVGAKGGCSVYGLGRFPVTLYHDQWLALLAEKERLLEFLEQHKAEFKMKA